VNVNFTNDPPAGTGTIQGTKYCQDCTEPGCGIPGWTITLSYTNGTIYDSRITGFGGLYEFNDVPYGTYWLNETIQEGWTQVTPNIMVVLDETNQSFTYDFINTETIYCCGCKPTASFTYARDGPTVTFTDTSTGPIAQRWIWFFGDGTLSTAQNPVKSYKKPGTYTVTLHVNWAYCSDSPPVWKSYSQRITIS
jgi:PKD repeat protein